MKSFDVVVVGAGPGGYVTAIRCAQYGMKTAIVEKQYFGGTCLNVGCIPSKAMIHAANTVDKISHADIMGIETSKPKVHFEKMIKWKNDVVGKLTGGVKQLLKANGVEAINGHGKFIDKNTLDVGGEKITFKNAIIATGSTIADLPFAKPDGKRIINSTQALDLPEIPKRLVVVGGGFIGMEIGTVYRKLGSEVIVIEKFPEILPGTDRECVAVVEKKAKKLGIEIRTNVELKGVTANANQVIVDIGTEKIEASHCLMTVGRKPYTDNLGLEKLGIETVKPGVIPVDSFLRTKVPNIFAIGDVVDGPMLAHKASFEGLCVAETLKGKPKDRTFRALPWAIFTDPEIAVVGMTEEEAKKKGRTVKVSKFPFAANGRALSTNETDGFVKIIADAKTDELLGCHMVGPEVSNLISEPALGMEMGGSAEDLGLTIHAHPTLPESIMEACEGIHNKMVHMYQKNRS